MLNLIFSVAAGPIKAKVYMWCPWDGRMKVYINSQGHMTKMAAMAINSKNIEKSSSPEPEGLRF